MGEQDIKWSHIRQR